MILTELNIFEKQQQLLFTNITCEVQTSHYKQLTEWNSVYVGNLERVITLSIFLFVLQTNDSILITKLIVNLILSKTFFHQIESLHENRVDFLILGHSILSFK